VGPRTGLDDVEKRKFLPLPGLKLRPLCRPSRSQSLSRLPATPWVACLFGTRALLCFLAETQSSYCVGSLFRLKAEVSIASSFIKVSAVRIGNRLYKLPRIIRRMVDVS
jgi:hypothetical protein